ncbi:MAG TPA: amino acid ABC transporter substrate-binding protein [Dongiaceae bacterium]|jgi:general L-amino acid transport system substrate-binding protein|nr:amino acid ABC transporter substrate-binding protein [Dongiaceae bacterium]
MKKQRQLASIGMAAALVLLGWATASAGTLDQVKQNGKVRCGVNTGQPGFSAPNEKGEWHGIDSDLCKAVAAAVFGDPNKVEFKPLSSEQRFTALQTGEIDMLSRNSTWTLSRDTQLGLDFVAVNYYDGQGFMVRKNSGVKSALELKGASVCVQQGTTTEKNLGDFNTQHQLNFKVVTFKDSAEARPAYDEGRCDAYTTDASGLAGERTALKSPEDHVILPEIISKEPLGPAVRHGDNQWADIVRWAHYVTVIAEEKGITQGNVDDVKKSSQDPEVQRLLGVTDKMGEGMGLSKDWAYNIIKAVGNYGEIFERNIGTSTPIRLDRGLNALWNKGGLQYAPPVR